MPCVDHEKFGIEADQQLDASEQHDSIGREEADAAVTSVQSRLIEAVDRGKGLPKLRLLDDANVGVDW